LPKHLATPAQRAKRARAAKGASPEILEARRDLLLERLFALHAAAKQTPGYRTAANLLNPIFRRSSLAARVAVLEAAKFMIEILERIPPLT